MSDNSQEQLQQSDPIYLDLAAGSEEAAVTQIESVCMNCMEKGMTRLLLTLIPHFREVMVSSFSCPHCHYSDSSLLNTGVIQDKGIKFTLRVNTSADLRRMIVKSDYAIINIPIVELEIPGKMGEITCVEGVINKVCEGLQMDQGARREEDPDLATKIEHFIQRLKALLDVTEPFTLELNDPTGNSFIEKFGSNGFTDNQVAIREYERNAKLNEMLGIAAPSDQDNQGTLDEVKEEEDDDDEQQQLGAEKRESKVKSTKESSSKAESTNETSSKAESTTEISSKAESTNKSSSKAESAQEIRSRAVEESVKENNAEPFKENPARETAVAASNCNGGADDTNDAREEEDDDDDDDDIHYKVLQFSTLCEICFHTAETKMKLTQIPHFKEVVIMATVCDHCGNKTSEVKSGGGIAPLGRKITLELDEVSIDMARDVLKSDTCSVEIPSLDLHVGAGILGGKFTTLEGLLINIKDDIGNNPFFTGDSVDGSKKKTVNNLLESLEKIISGDLKTTIVLDDPAGNSYMQNVYAPDPDPFLTVLEYERTFEQNEDLGINDMKTEGYEQD
uniref:Zinc finger protein ZPR1-like n=2 Tax=Hirondellea gigas TaxID=1518452 RepID=A0A2P2HXN1_9CRUS